MYDLITYSLKENINDIYFNGKYDQKDIDRVIDETSMEDREFLYKCMLKRAAMKKAKGS